MAKPNQTPTLNDILGTNYSNFSEKQLDKLKDIIDDAIAKSVKPENDGIDFSARKGLVNFRKQVNEAWKAKAGFASTQSVAKIIDKVKAQPKPQVQTTPIPRPQPQFLGTGTTFKSPQGQGSLFRDTSRYKYAKASISSNTSTAVPENQLGFDFNTKAKSKPKVKQLTEAETDKLVAKFHKDGEMFANNDVLIAKVVKATAKVSKVAKEAKVARGPRERTPHEIAREARLKQKADAEYLKAQTASRKVSIDKNTEYAKMRHHKNHDETMLMRQELTEKARDKIDKRKFNKHKLTLANKESLMNTHIKLKEMDMHKLEIKHRHDIEKGEARQRIQLERNKQSNRAKMESHLHKIHPALGALYGMHQNSKDEREASGGMGASALAGGVGGVGGMLGKTAMGKMGGMLGKVGGLSGLLKSAIKTAPFIAAVGGGVIEGIESRDAKKGLATASAGIIGAYLGGAIGTLFAPGVGTAVGAGVGAWLGNLAGKGLYNSAHGLSDKQDEGLRDAYGKSSAPKSSVSNSVIKSSKPQVMGGGDFTQRTAKTTSGGDFISKAEGISLKAYPDGAINGKPMVSIGRGHQIKADELAQGYIQIGDERVPISGVGGINSKLTKEQAEKLYLQDNQKYTDIARRGIGAERFDKLSENKKSAITSYAYNVGSVGSLTKKGLKAALDSGDDDAAAKIIRNGINTQKGVFDKGVDNRRKMESQLFLDKSPSMAMGLQQADNNYQKTSASVKSQPVNVVMQGGNSSGGTSVVNNTTVHAPVVDATIRQLQYATQQHARIV